MAQPPSSSTHSILAALQRLEARSESTASGWRLLLYGMVLVPLGIGAVPLALGVVLPSWLYTAMLSGLGLGLLAMVYAAWLRPRVRRRLEDSDLSRRIASGELLDDAIFICTPWPWLLLLPGRTAGAEFGPALSRIAGNLDWYLKPPRRLWRASWIYEPLLAVVLLACIAELGGYVGLPVLQIHPLLLTSGLCLLLPLPFIKFRRQVWTEELVRYLQRALDHDPERSFVYPRV